MPAGKGALYAAPAPMEDAPRDGTAILAAFIWKGDGLEAGVHSTKWHEPWGTWVCSSVLIRFDGTGDDDDDAVPVGWWPLPPHPGARAEAAAPAAEG